MALKHPRPFVALAGLAAALIGCGAADAQTFSPADLSGAELFERFCAACHGTGAEGDGPVAAGLVTAVPDLTRIRLRNGGRFPADAVRDAIDGRTPVRTHGTRVMPVWGYEFWVEEGADIGAERAARDLVRRLVLYLESIQDG